MNSVVPRNLLEENKLYPNVGAIEIETCLNKPHFNNTGYRTSRAREIQPDASSVVQTSLCRLCSLS